MSNRVGVYDSEAGTLIFCGIPIKDGRAEKFLEYEPEGPAFEDEIGADGLVMRYATHERRYKGVLTLLGGSSHNQQLSALHGVDASTTNGISIGPFLYKDGTGVTILAGAQCWITKAPKFEVGKTRGPLAWEFRVVSDPSKSLMGGN